MTSTHHTGSWDPRTVGWIAVMVIAMIVGIIVAIGFVLAQGANWVWTSTSNYLVSLSTVAGSVPTSLEQTWANNGTWLWVVGSVVALVLLVAGAIIFYRVRQQSAVKGWGSDDH